MQHKEAAAELGRECRPLPPILYTNHKIIKCHPFILPPQKNIFDHLFLFLVSNFFFDSELHYNWQPQMPLEKVDKGDAAQWGHNIQTGLPQT